MKYYLVALFDKDSYSNIVHIQRNIGKKYKLHHKSLKPHITLEILEEPDINKLDKLITKILAPYKKFKININKTLYFETPYKSVNLTVENKGYIITIARNINNTLKLAQFNVIENKNNSDLHIFLGKSGLNSLNSTTNKYISFGKKYQSTNCYNLAKITRLELWKSVNNKRNTVIKTYNLRDY